MRNSCNGIYRATYSKTTEADLNSSEARVTCHAASGTPRSCSRAPVTWPDSRGGRLAARLHETGRQMLEATPDV